MATSTPSSNPSAQLDAIDIKKGGISLNSNVQSRIRTEAKKFVDSITDENLKRQTINAITELFKNLDIEERQLTTKLEIIKNAKQQEILESSRAKLEQEKKTIEKKQSAGEFTSSVRKIVYTVGFIDTNQENNNAVQNFVKGAIDELTVILEFAESLTDPESRKALADFLKNNSASQIAGQIAKGVWDSLTTYTNAYNSGRSLTATILTVAGLGGVIKIAQRAGRVAMNAGANAAQKTVSAAAKTTVGKSVAQSAHSVKSAVQSTASTVKGTVTSGVTTAKNLTKNATQNVGDAAKAVGAKVSAHSNRGIGNFNNIAPRAVNSKPQVAPKAPAKAATAKPSTSTQSPKNTTHKTPEYDTFSSRVDLKSGKTSAQRSMKEFTNETGLKTTTKKGKEAYINEQTHRWFENTAIRRGISGDKLKNTLGKSAHGREFVQSMQEFQTAGVRFIKAKAGAPTTKALNNLNESFDAIAKIKPRNFTVMREQAVFMKASLQDMREVLAKKLAKVEQDLGKTSLKATRRTAAELDQKALIQALQRIDKDLLKYTSIEKSLTPSFAKKVAMAVTTGQLSSDVLLQMRDEGVKPELLAKMGEIEQNSAQESDLTAKQLQLYGELMDGESAMNPGSSSTGATTSTEGKRMDQGVTQETSSAGQTVVRENYTDDLRHQVTNKYIRIHKGDINTLHQRLAQIEGGEQYVKLLDDPNPINIRELQKLVGMPAGDNAQGQDGMLGNNTIKAIERFLAEKRTNSPT